jgi:hypothetical protein
MSVSLFSRLIGKPTIEEFGDQLVRALKKVDRTNDYRLVIAENRIARTKDGKETGSTNLANFYPSYLATPRLKRAEQFARYVRLARNTVPTLPSDFAEARPNLRPKLWSRLGLDEVRLRQLYTGSDARGLDLPCQPIGEHLLAGLAYDWPDSVQSISADDLKEWGVTVYEALEAAIENLDGSTDRFAKLGDHLYSFVCEDTYDAARLMLVDRIKGFELEGSPVAMVPNRDSILITGSEDNVGLEMMAELAMKGLDQPYSLSGIPLILQDGEWVDWMPPSTCPSYAKFRELELRFYYSIYAEQKKLLDAAHERGGRDIYVATFSAVSKEDRGPVSYRTWTKEVDTLLPVTQKVFFVQGEEGAVALAEWERVFEIVGHLMELTDDYPRRYRVREFPNQAALEAIGLGEL